MSEDLQNDNQFKQYAYVTKQDLVDVYKKYDKKYISNAKNEENGEIQHDEESNEQSEADLLFLIQAPSGSAIRIPVE